MTAPGTQVTVADPRRYAAWLWLLTVLFAFRVAAQPAALVLDSILLPPFESWHGGVLPYPVLLATQLGILGWLVTTAWRFTAARIVPRGAIGRGALVFGGVYFTVMLVRLVLGATVFQHVRWFNSPLPSFFHLVLAAYLLIFGWFHVSGARPGSNLHQAIL